MTFTIPHFRRKDEISESEDENKDDDGSAAESGSRRSQKKDQADEMKLEFMAKLII